MELLLGIIPMIGIFVAFYIIGASQNKGQEKHDD